MAILIPADSSKGIERVAPAKDGKFTLAEMQGFVGGYIELVNTADTGQTLWCNEEGKLQNLPYNHRATTLANLMLANLPGDVLVGDVLVTEPGEVD